VWPLPIIVLPPSLDLLLSILQRKKPALVQIFLAQPPVEGFYECVVRGLSQPGEVQLHSIQVGPLIQCLGGDAIYTQLFDAMRVALSSAIQDGFFIGFFLVLIAFVVTMFLKEVPLRRRNVMGPSEEAMPEGTAQPAPDPAVGED